MLAMYCAASREEERGRGGKIWTFWHGAHIVRTLASARPVTCPSQACKMTFTTSSHPDVQSRPQEVPASTSSKTIFIFIQSVRKIEFRKFVGNSVRTILRRENPFAFFLQHLPVSKQIDKEVDSESHFPVKKRRWDPSTFAHDPGHSQCESDAPELIPRYQYQRILMTINAYNVTVS